jgi:hypothetical protein
MTLPSRSLCHPDGLKSCGACCGLYNHRAAGQEATLERLTRRTLAYRQDADIQDTTSLQRFRADWEDGPDTKLLGGLPSCPFLGLLDLRTPGDDPRSSRVGCLVHPLQNDGVDGRDCGVYDRFVCEDYLCASHDLLRVEEAQLVICAVQDSFLYGLIITDVRLIRALLEGAARLNGRAPSPADLARPAAIRAAAAFFELRRDWPYAAPDASFGQVIPLSGLSTRRRQDPAQALGAPPDPLTDAALACLGTLAPDLDTLTAARALVAARIQAFAAEVNLVPGARP